ncbi:hypothetical protein [Methylobacterium sp. J-067]|uniref:hypothetical protein n=1 Tax=Methylobacterium sp. J-067 TaxID=2836648 RepID=UPI001FBAF549|nr:hypothetical protein [Methylobacterium sp. J-067]MCJ2023238.1 hypothetical protein [Methylobacterium sp. J-067]
MFATKTTRTSKTPKTKSEFFKGACEKARAAAARKGTSSKAEFASSLNAVYAVVAATKVRRQGLGALLYQAA